MQAIAERSRTANNLEPRAGARPVPPGRWRKGRHVTRGSAQPAGVPWPLVASNLLGFHLAVVTEREGVAVVPVALLLAFDGLWGLCQRRRIERIHAWTLVAWGIVCAWGASSVLAPRGGLRGPVAAVAMFSLLIFFVGMLLDRRTAWFRSEGARYLVAALLALAALIVHFDLVASRAITFT